MPLMDPSLKACCDKCQCDSEELYLEPLAQCGSYDERSVPKQLKAFGWTIDGDKTYCPDCQP